MTLRLGSIVHELPYIYGPGSTEEARITEGTVVYIHPARRYYTIEFTNSLGWSFRESFFLPPRSGSPECV